MNKLEAKAKLEELNAAISTAVLLIKSQGDTLTQFFHESRQMDSVGPILDPTLFNSSERRATEALLKPVYEAVQRFVDTYDRQIEAAQSALARVRR